MQELERIQVCLPRLGRTHFQSALTLDWCQEELKNVENEQQKSH